MLFKSDPRYKHYRNRYRTPYVTIQSTQKGKRSNHMAVAMGFSNVTQRWEVLDARPVHDAEQPAIVEGKRLAKELGIEFKRS